MVRKKRDKKREMQKGLSDLKAALRGSAAQPYPTKSKYKLARGLLQRTVGQIITNADAKPGRNDPCPCGSGKKYKKCCLHDGNPHMRQRTLPAPKENVADSRTSPIIVCPEEKASFTLDHVLEALRKAGVKECYIYAAQQTGRFVKPEARAMYDDKTLAAWDAAVQEYCDKHGEDPPESDETISPEVQVTDTGE